jgi:hypothetical protein
MMNQISTTQFTPDLKAPQAPHPIVLALAAAMGRLIGCQDRCVTRDDLIAEGFTEAELAAHGTEATALARQNFIRTLGEHTATEHLPPGAAEPDCLPSIRPLPPGLPTRAERVAAGAAIIAGLMPDIRPIHLALKGRGFTSREISDLMPDILAVAGDEFAAILHGGSA